MHTKVVTCQFHIFTNLSISLMPHGQFLYQSYISRNVTAKKAQNHKTKQVKN